MKKVILFCLLSGMTVLAYAETCPAVKEILIKRGQNYEIVAPPGWRVSVNEKKPEEKYITFAGAGWGDYTRSRDHVRCHYYHIDKQHIELDTETLIDESQIISHPEWDEGNLFHLCTSYNENVNDCPFG